MSHEIPEGLLGDRFCSAAAVAAGLTYKQLKSHRFRHVFHDVYVNADVPDSVGLRCSAAALLLPPSAVFCAVRLPGSTTCRYPTAMIVSTLWFRPGTPTRRGSRTSSPTGTAFRPIR